MAVKRFDIEAFVAERNAALLSLDRARITAYAKKWRAVLPTHPEAFWPAVHMARLQVTTFDDSVKAESTAWLLANGWIPDESKPMGWRLRR